MKKQIKKGLSLMLAVLMVLSCWVWVAPTKADAASSVYTVTFNVKVNNADDGGDPDWARIFYMPNNGTGGETYTTASEITFDFSNATSASRDYTISVPGWPSAIYFETNAASATDTEVVISNIRINERTVVDGTWTVGDSGTTNAARRWFIPDSASGGSATSGKVSSNEDKSDAVAEGTWNWPKPEIAQLDGDMGDLTVPALNKVGGADVTSPTMTFNKFADQYGVTWTASSYATANMEFYISNTAGGNEYLCEDADGNNTIYATPVSGTTNQAKVTAKSALQTIHRYNDAGNLGTLYLVAKMEYDDGTRQYNTTSSSKLILTYPKYNWIFYGNGDGTVSTSPVTKIELTDGTTTSTQEGDFSKTAYKYYGQTIKDLYPTGNVTKEGYTFYGFWTAQQPASASDMSNPYAFESDFIQPIDTATYETMTDDQKALYYPAGVKYDPKQDSSLLETTKDTVYYAWWISDDITVKFYDINGKFLGEKAVKYGQNNNAFVWPTPQETYESGSFSYSAWNGWWENVDGEEVNSKGHTFTHDLILTPIYDTISFTDTYKVTFYNTYSVNPWAEYTKDYSYRTAHADVAVPSESEVTALPADAQDYSYTFEGWSGTAPTTDTKYHVMLEDGDFDVNGNAVYLVSDFTVREDATYYPVFRRHLKSHDVTFEYKDSTGADKTVTKTFKYGEIITAPDGIPAEYATEGYGYTFLGWTRDNNDVTLSHETCKPGLRYTAKYSEGVPTPYTVTFVYRNEAGEEVTTSAQVNHGQNILQETVDSLNPYKEYDNGEALVTYNGIWEYNGTRYETADLVNFSPVNHVTFTAVYENPKTFYKVTYVDGSATKEFRITDGTALPFWTYEVAGEDGETTQETYLPKRDDTVEGRYTFTGWFDAKEGGNKYVPGETPVTADVTLYPQFSFGLFEYHIVFQNWDGTQLVPDEDNTFNYGEDVTALTAKAEAAAIRPADAVYTYQFIGWDKKVPTFCEGGEPGSTLTFVAQYKPVYIYYNVEWFNDLDSMNADTEDNATQLHTSKYVYGDKIHTPSVTLTVPDNAPAGQNYVFAGWYYTDANGEPKPFDRNMTVTGNMKFYATYALTAKMWTVEVVIDDDTSYELKVADGTIITDLVSDPASGYVNTEYHNAFSGWTLDAVGGTAFDIENDAIVADTKIYANFTQSAHVYDKSEVTVTPTYPMAAYQDFDGTVVEATDGKGELTKWCACDTKRENVKTEEIPALTDTVVPSGTGYIGTQWNSKDGFADEDATIAYAGPKTDIIITTSDKGDVVADFNETGKGIGVQAIYASICSSNNPLAEEDVVVDAANFTISCDKWDNWTKVYDWTQIQGSLIQYYEGWNKVPAMYQDYNANYTAKLGQYGVTDGDKYFVYAVIIDKAGNYSFMKSAEFLYDATAPAMTITGASNEAEDKYCETVTITVDEQNLESVTANGTALTADESGSYVINTVGVYNVVVTDKAGNKTSAYFQVAAHDYHSVTTPATCTQDGYVANTCSNCGHEKDIETPEELECKGHIALKTVTTAATCTAIGYDTITCSACGHEEIVDVVQNADGSWSDKYPALDHDWSAWTTTKTVNCQVNGAERRTCKRCGASETRDVVSAGTEHNWYTAVLTKPTCTLDGERTRTCRICGTLEVLAHGYEDGDAKFGGKYTAENFDASLKAAGHTESEEYKVVTKATCAADGSKVKYCTVCDAIIEGSEVAISKDTVAHTWYIKDPTTDVVAPTETTKGTTKYTCKVCGVTRTVEDTEVLTMYTVTFYSEDGTEIDSFKQAKGTTIAADAVADQTKANSADGKTKYTFAGWYTKENGEYKTKYALPMTVSADLELYAKFTESDIIYTLTFEVPTTYTEKTDTDGATYLEFGGYKETKVLMGAMDDEREPAATPSFQSDAKYTFTFDGWAKAGKEVEDVIIITGDETYQAQFAYERNTYDVIFMNGTQALGKVAVPAGGTAVYDEAKFGKVEKASDATYHYTFTGWDKSLENITAKTTVYAQFNTKAEHTWDAGTLKQAATCTLPEIKTFECTTCGYAEDRQTAEANKHNPGEPVFEETTGQNVVKCTVCGEEISRTDASYTIVFLNENGSRLDTVTVEVNGKVVYEGVTPEKASDAQNSYVFAGWVVQGTTAPVYATADIPAATANTTYVATFTATVRKYIVTFLDKDDKVLQTGTYEYGTSVSYNGDTNALATPAADSKGHYTFSKWDTATANITKDTLVRPVFTQSPHSYTDTETGATCTEAGGIKHACACGYYYIDGNVPAIGHNWKVTQEIAPDYAAGTNGKRIYTCLNGCGETYEEVISGEMTQITVNVKDQDGNPVEGALVRLYAKDATGNYVDTGYSDRTTADGIVIFMVKPGEYRVFVSVDGMEETWYDITVDENGKVTGNKDEVVVQKPTVDTSCSCSCHRDNFWGAFFRFFQKIIKLFTGKPSCCADPDSRI